MLRSYRRKVFALSPGILLMAMYLLFIFQFTITSIKYQCNQLKFDISLDNMQKLVIGQTGEGVTDFILYTTVCDPTRKCRQSG
jgi:hypothetical protein